MKTISRSIEPVVRVVLCLALLGGPAFPAGAQQIQFAPGGQSGAGSAGAAGAGIAQPAAAAPAAISVNLGGLAPTLAAPALQARPASISAPRTALAGPSGSVVSGEAGPGRRRSLAPSAGQARSLSLPAGLNGNPGVTQRRQAPGSESLSPAEAVPAVDGAPVIEAQARLGAQAPVGGLAPARVSEKAAHARLIPRVDAAALAPAGLDRMPASKARAEGAALMDRVLRTRSAGSGNAAEPVEAEAGQAVVKPGQPTVKPARGATEAGQGAAVEAQGREGAKPDPAPLVQGPKRTYDPLNRPYSPYRFTMFQYDPESYALTFIFGKESKEPKGFELLIGLAVHEALEKAFTWISQGEPSSKVSVERVIREYEAAFERGLKAESYKERDGWTIQEYRRRGENYIRRKWAQKPFDDIGKVLSLEERVLWTMKDPATGRSYEFKGKIDRLMIKGDTVYIRDWKTHFTPPTIGQLERDDIQLGLYAIGLLRARPDLVKGRKIKLVWDYKEFRQEIDVTPEYLARIEAKVFDLLRRMDTFTERVQAEKGEWLKRIKPEARPAGLAKARQAADGLGRIRAQLDEKSALLRALKREYERLEDGLLRYAQRHGMASIKGRRASLSVEAKTSRDVPTKTSDPEGNASVVAILREGGVWLKYSKLDPAAVRAMAEVQGGSDHAVYQRIKGDLPSGFDNWIDVQPAEEASQEGRGGGVKRPRLPRDPIAPDAEPGVYSPTQLAVFLENPDDFARQYVLRDKAPMAKKPMGMLAGGVIHETMEQLFIWIKGGRLVKDIKLADVLAVFEERWAANREEAEYAPDPGLTEEDYKRGSIEYVKAKWNQMHPFADQGETIFLERRVFFTLTDPTTGKTFKFQGIPDRVMLEGDTVVIRDWKSHYKAPSDAEVRRKDYQLGLYVLALRQHYPDLMKGRKARLVWDFKDRQTVIEADDAYIADLEKRLFEVLRKMDALRTDVEANWEAYEERLIPGLLPKDGAEASSRVDRLAELDGQISAMEAEAKDLKAAGQAYENEIIGFSRKTGHARIQGKEYASTLRKGGFVDVPTKTNEPDAFNRVVSILKEAGVWERYSTLDYPALKKALADPKNPDREVLRRIEPLMREVKTLKGKLTQAGETPRSAGR